MFNVRITYQYKVARTYYYNSTYNEYIINCQKKFNDALFLCSAIHKC